ncbi:MAG: hypothetical protein RRZ83_05110 [Alistipes sp.]
MKKNFLRWAITVVAIAALGGGCSDDPTPDPVKPPVPPEPKPQEQTFTINCPTVDITQTEASFNIAPTDKNATYYYNIVEKSVLDRLATDDALIASDQKALEAAAKAKEISLQEFLGQVLVKGNTVQLTDKLFASVEYTVYAYGMTAEGKANTAVFKKSFTTLPATKVALSFQITPTVKGTAITFAMVPSDKTAAYYYSLVSKKDYEYLGSSPQAVALYALKQMVKMGAEYGMNREQTMEQIRSIGDKSQRFAALAEHTDYVFFACAIDRLGNICSDVAIVNCTTAEFQGSKNTFTFTVPEEEITATSAHVILHVANEDPYIWMHDKVEKWAGRTNDQFISDYVKEWGWLLNMGMGVDKGDHDLKYSLVPNTKYRIIAFGYEKEVTTEPTTLEFTTKPGGDPANTTFVFDRTKLSPFSVSYKITPSDNTVPFLAAVIDKAVYEKLGGTPAVIKKLIEDDIAGYIAASAAQGHPATATDYLEGVGGYGVSYISYSPDYAPLVPNTKYIPYAIAMNTDATMPVDPIFGAEFTTPEDIVSKATATMTIPEFFDGDVMAAARPDLYANAAGQVTSHVLITPSADAVHWYCASVIGDQSSLTDYPEKTIVDWLVSTGQKDQRELLFASPWGQPISFMVVAEDAKGNWGVSQRIVLTFDKAGVSDPTEFLAQQKPTTQSAKMNALHYTLKGVKGAKVSSLLRPQHRSEGMQLTDEVQIPFRLQPQPKKPFVKHAVMLIDPASMVRFL